MIVFLFFFFWDDFLFSKRQERTQTVANHSARVLLAGPNLLEKMRKKNGPLVTEGAVLPMFGFLMGGNQNYVSPDECRLRCASTGEVY